MEIFHKLQKFQIYVETIYIFIAEMTIKPYLYFHLVVSGVISVLSNIMPKQTSKMVHDFLEGNIEVARKFQLASLHLTSALFAEVNPIPVKAALNLIGYNFGIPRLPLTEASDKTKEILKYEMKSLEIL